MMNVTAVGEYLSRILMVNPYVPIWLRHMGQMSIAVGSYYFTLSYSPIDSSCALRVSGEVLRPHVIIDSSLLQPRPDSLPVLVVTRADLPETFMELFPTAQLLAQRCFSLPPFPLDDREELLFPFLFGNTSTILWDQPDLLLKVIRYTRGNRSWVVTSGFSEPWAWPHADMYDDQVSGAGYELIMQHDNEQLSKEVIGWAKYIASTKNHIVPGNWLEYEGGRTIPTTDFAGFLIAAPTKVPESFPIGATLAYLHEMIPVTKPLLEEAKRSSVYDVLHRNR